MRSFAIFILAALATYALGDYIISHVMIVDSAVDMLGCATNRCVNVNDTTFLVK